MLQFPLSASNQRLKYPSAKHAQILLSEGGRGCPGPTDEKKSSDKIFIIFLIRTG